ncbi:MAG: hypothetical protein AAFQ51_18250, partial [Pseudomonadota bacterium]
MTDLRVNDHHGSAFEWIWALDTRLLEITLALVMLVRGIMKLTPGSVTDYDVYSVFHQIAPEEVWGVLFAVCGIVHLVALYINGRWKTTPSIRIGA